MRAFRNELAKPGEEGHRNRKLGRAAFSPAVESRAERDIYRNWSVPELSLATFLHAPDNSVLIGRAQPKEVESGRMPHDPAATHRLWRSLNRNVFLNIKGVRPAMKIAGQRRGVLRQGSCRQEASRHRVSQEGASGEGNAAERAQQRAYHVGKYVSRTGLTFGIVGEIEAIVRYRRSGSYLCCWADLIVSDNRDSRYPGRSFADKGDSEACVFDMDAKAASMVKSGLQSCSTARLGNVYDEDATPAPEGAYQTYVVPPGFTDFDAEYGGYGRARGDLTMLVTFATPMELLFDDIKNFTGLKPEIIPAQTNGHQKNVGQTAEGQTVKVSINGRHGKDQTVGETGGAQLTVQPEGQTHGDRGNDKKRPIEEMGHQRHEKRARIEAAPGESSGDSKEDTTSRGGI